MKRLLISAVALAMLSMPAVAAPKKLTAQELKMAQQCKKQRACTLTCNRAHEAGRDDLIRAGACAE